MKLAPAGDRARIAALAAALAMPLEGLHQIAYYDPAGVLTVCWGSTKNVQPGRKYSLAECEARLSDDMQEAVDAVDRCAPGLPDGPRVAFADAVFNLGPKIVCDTRASTAARMLKIGNIEGACNQLPRWDKARIAGVMVSLPGLTKRRALERDVCLQ